MENEVKQKGNQCGIIGMCVGWAMPVAGLVLGIVALGRGERTKSYGVISIIESVVFWAIWIAINASK